MTTKYDAARLQPALIAVALVATVLAALVLLIAGRLGSQQAEVREHAAALASLSQNIPLQAGAAVRGSAPAFDALAESRAQLEQVLARIDSGGGASALGTEPGRPWRLEPLPTATDEQKARLSAWIGQ
mgnify:CR=1 FL=1